MNKTISVNIHGLNFLIEEDAHARLSGYLADINQHFGTGANVEEVMSDIEASIAEKLQSTLTPFKNVVTLADVDNLIRVMGTARDFDEAVGEDTKSGDEPKTETVTQIKRRLYRDPDNAVIAGVAAGLGAYFDIDPVLFRILFVIFIFFGGFSIPLYLVLWIVMPEAKTLNQKLEMRGQAPTLDALERLTQKKDVQKNQSPFYKVISVPFVVIGALFGALQRFCRRVAPVVRVILGVFFILAALIFLVGIGIGAAYALLNVNSPYKLEFVPIAELTHAVPFVWLVLTAFFSLAIPAFLLLFGGITLALKKTVVNFASASIIIGLWMISGIAFGALGLRYFPDMATKAYSYPAVQTEQRPVDISGVTQLAASGAEIRLVLNSGTSTAATISGRRADLDQVDLKTVDHRLTVTQKKRISDQQYCLGCHMMPVTLTLDGGALQNIEIKNYAQSLINGNLKSNPKISADTGAEITWSDLKNQTLTATLGKYSTLSVGGSASSVSATLDGANLYATTLNAKTFDITAKNSSDAVIGQTEKLTVDAADDSRVLYAGKPVLISKQAKASHIAPYRLIQATEYRTLSEAERTAEDAGLTPTSTAIAHGTDYLLLERGSLSEEDYQAFRAILEDSDNH